MTCQFAVWHVTRRFNSFLGEQKLLYNKSNQLNAVLFSHGFQTLDYNVRSERLNILKKVKPLVFLISIMCKFA